MRHAKARRPQKLRSFGVSLAIAAAVGVGGCASPGIPFYRADSTITVESRANPATRLTTAFDRAFYSYDGRDSVTIVLLAGPEDEPTQAATLRLFWRPKAGRTPISSQATNATIQYVILPPATEDGAAEVGVYSGAGFMFPASAPGGAMFEAGLWDATLLLADQSAGFRDQLGQSAVEGSLTARRDDAAVEAELKRLSARVSARLGYPRFVSAD